MHRGGWRVFALRVLSKTAINVMKMLLPPIAALAIQPVVFLIYTGLPFAFSSSDSFPWDQLPAMAALVMAFALPHLLFLGIPVFLLLRWKGRLSFPWIALSGFLIGMLLPLIVGWPRACPGCGYSAGFHGQTRDLMVDGKTTLYGWLAFAESGVTLGLHGVAGALAFYFTWKWLQGRQPSEAASLGTNP